MMHVYARIEAVGPLAFLATIIAVVALLYLADHLLTTYDVHRHKHDGIDPRVLNAVRQRVEAQRPTRG